MDNDVVNNIKSLAIDMINNASSGHPGIALGAANIIYTLYANHLNVSSIDDKWLNRDRFVMSAGHGSALLYATLYMAGFNLSLDDLKNFRKSGFKTPGHPEVNVTPGVDATTGPLGQGLAMAVGMALASKIQKEMTKFDNKKSLIDYNVYVLCGDGDMMEGISSEAASFAGNLNLDNLIVLYDSNNISLDGSTSMTFSDDVLARFKAMNFHTIKVKNGNNIKEIDRAIKKAKMINKPTIIEIKTTIGSGSLIEGTNKVHGNPLTDEDTKQLKAKLLFPDEPFIVNEKARDYFKNKITSRSSRKYNEWSNNYRDLVSNKLKLNKNVSWIFGSKDTVDLTELKVEIDDDLKESLRVSNSKVMHEIAKYIPNFIGGSADLSSSTLTYLHGFKDVKQDDYDGRNIHFGVREHAMGAILNGLALCNFKPYGSTFLAFSDYLKPAIRESALMNLPVTYIFTHDSINIGEDGPTHQPIEQLTTLRSIPNLYVFRPCDMHELLGCYNIIINNSVTSSLILSRNEVPLLSTTSALQVVNGAYIIKKEKNRLDGIIIATGSEVSIAYLIANDFYTRFNIDLRVVSMPCRELFIRTSEDYKNRILKKGVKTFVIEASTAYELLEFASSREYLLNITKFGISANKDDVSKYVGFDFRSLEEKIYKLMSVK